jgi:hypothetical protein
MADILRARASEQDARATTFQDFDVVYPVLEYTFQDSQRRLKVVATSEPGSEFSRSEFRYFYRSARSVFADPVAGSVSTSVVEDWTRICRAVESVPPPPLVNLREEDFAITGQLDLQELLPLLKPSPLTPVDIR